MSEEGGNVVLFRRRVPAPNETGVAEGVVTETKRMLGCRRCGSMVFQLMEGGDIACNDCRYAVDPLMWIDTSLVPPTKPAA